MPDGSQQTSQALDTRTDGGRITPHEPPIDTVGDELIEPALEGEVVDAELIEDPSTSLATAVRTAVWQPKGKIADALAKVLGGYDPDGRVSTAAAEMFAEYEMAKTTRYAYTYQLLRFVVWHGEHGKRHMPDRGEPPERCAEEMATNIRDWVAANYDMRRPDGSLRGHHGQPYSPSTVRLSLAAVGKMYEHLGWSKAITPTNHPKVRGQMRSYARKWATHRFKRDVAYVLTYDEMVAMVRSCDLGTVAGLRDAFLMRLAAEIGRRNSELMSLNWDDVIELSDIQWRVNIPVSKTNQFGDRPDSAVVEADTTLEPDIDTLRLGRLWRNACRALDLVGRGKPVFLKVHGGAKRKDGGLSGAIRSERMERGNYQEVVVAAGHRSGVLYDSGTGEVRKLVPHSFRAFMATWSAAAGVPLGTIADQGGWSRRSPVLLEYQRAGDQVGDNNPGTRMRQRELRRREQRERELAEARQRALDYNEDVRNNPARSDEDGQPAVGPAGADGAEGDSADVAGVSG
jgi:integrase